MSSPAQVKENMTMYLRELRFAWKTMKDDKRIVKVVTFYYDFARFVFYIPTLFAAFIAFHYAYMNLQSHTMLFMLGFLTISLVGVGMYSFSGTIAAATS